MGGKLIAMPAKGVLKFRDILDKCQKKWNLVGIEREGQLRTLVFRCENGKEEGLAFHVGPNPEIDITATKCEVT